jgi:hypothetical protein
VIDRLRTWLNRPLRDGDRARLFLAAVATILAGAGVLTLLDAPQGRPPRHSPPPAARTSPSPGTAVTVAPAETPNPPRSPAGGTPASRDGVEAAKRTARRFLADYVPYTYGRRPARSIRGATARLRRRLATQRPRVLPAVRRRRPRVLLVQAEGVSRTHAAVTVLVSDGGHRYTVELELRRARSGWTVTNLGA